MKQCDHFHPPPSATRAAVRRTVTESTPTGGTEMELRLVRRCGGREQTEPGDRAARDKINCSECVREVDRREHRSAGTRELELRAEPGPSQVILMDSHQT